MGDKLIILAGATGDLGGRIAGELLARGAAVRAIVRPGGKPGAAAALRQAGAEIAEADYGSMADLARACAGGACLVSALSGLDEVILRGQSALLDAAIAAGVPRFIPSDYSIDFTRLAPGSNRNLDLRRAFHARLDAAPLAATSIFCGMFAELLNGQAPIVLRRFKRVAYWESPDQPMDFTTRADAAAFTAAAALDPGAPRFLHIAGDRQSARGLAIAAGAATGSRFRLLRAGGLGRLELLIKLAKTIAPQRGAIYPAWQGMAYLRDMFGGRALVERLDNDRYPGLRWTPVRAVLAGRRPEREAAIGA